MDEAEQALGAISVVDSLGQQGFRAPSSPSCNTMIKSAAVEPFRIDDRELPHISQRVGLRLRVIDIKLSPRSGARPTAST